jgi:hypothetical protein
MAGRGRTGQDQETQMIFDLRFSIFDLGALRIPKSQIGNRKSKIP